MEGIFVLGLDIILYFCFIIYKILILFKKFFYLKKEYEKNVFNLYYCLEIKWDIFIVFSIEFVGDK